MDEKINLRQVTISPGEVITIDGGANITLYDSHLIYRAKGVYSAEDEDEIMGIVNKVERKYDVCAAVIRERVSLINLFYNYPYDNWVIEFCGTNIGFEKKSEAVDVWDKLYRWAFR